MRDRLRPGRHLGYRRHALCPQLALCGKFAHLPSTPLNLVYIPSVISRRLISPALILSIVLGLIPSLAASPAHAAPAATATVNAATVGPGAPMRLRPYDADRPFGPEGPTFAEVAGIEVHPDMLNSGCTQGAVGEVELLGGGTQRVMITAGHCLIGEQQNGILMGATVYAPTRDGYIPIGTIDLVHTANLPGGYDNIATAARKAPKTEDWGVVVLDAGALVDGSASSLDRHGAGPGAPATLHGVRDYRTLAPGEFAVDNFGQPVCKEGSISGRSCGIQLFYTENNVWSWALDYASGDSGGINYDPRTGEVIGVTSLGLGPIGTAQRVDRALEQAYEIPDGAVNTRFRTAAPEHPRADFVTANEEEEFFKQYIVDHNPDVSYEDFRRPDPREQFESAVAAAQTDAGVIAQDVRDFAIVGAVAAASGVPLDEISAAGQSFAENVTAYAGAHVDNIANTGLYWALSELGYE